MSRIVIAGGGTAGHVIPALAVADVLTSRRFEVHFVGAGGMESRLVLREGYPFTRIRIRGFERKPGLGTLRTLFSLPAAAVDAARLLARLRPSFVLGVGAYASGPVVAEAALVGIPTAAIEMDAHLGWTNRMLSRLVDRVFLSFPIPHVTGAKFAYTGRPIRPGLLDVSREEGRARFGFSPDASVVLVFGGSLGARSLNDAAFAAFGRHPTGYFVLHVAGDRDYGWMEERRRREGGNPRYKLYAYLDDFPLALAAADVAVSRSGGSVAELLARGIPSVLVPFPEATADHQYKNARSVVEAGAGVLVSDDRLSGERLVNEVERMLEPSVRGPMSRAACGLARPDAATRIVEEIVNLAGAERA